MNNIYNQHRCKTCRSWNQVYPGNNNLGVCISLPVLAGKDYVGLLPSSDWRDNPEPTRDIEILRTTEDFGCVSYQPKITDSN